MSKIEVSTWYCWAKNRSEDPEVASPYRVSCWQFLNLKFQIHDLNSITNRFYDLDSHAPLAASWGFALFGRAIFAHCWFHRNHRFLSAAQGVSARSSGTIGFRYHINSGSTPDYG